MDALPSPLRVVDAEMADGARIFLRHFGNTAGPRLIMSHGNGLAMDFYYPFWGPLLERFELVLYDFRNHGWNPPSAPEHHGFATFVFDNERVLAAIREHFEPKPMLGAFHSMAAVTAILQTLRVGACFDALVLFDPPLSPPSGHALETENFKHQRMMSTRAGRRAERYRSYEQFADLLKQAAQFRGLVDGAHALLARATLCEDPAGGGVVLRCPRELEARVFGSNVDATIALGMPDFPTPLRMVASDPNHAGAMVTSRLCRDLAAAWGVDYVAIPGTSHFLQVEQPEKTAAAMIDFFDGLGFLD